MKRILSILALVAIGFTANAQSKLMINPSNNPAKTGVVDTVKNTGTMYLQCQINPSTEIGYAGVTFNLEVTRYSGTAAGTAVLYGGIKGASGNITWDSLNVYTITNTASQTKNILYAYTGYGLPYEYYSLYISGGTTMGIIPKAKYYVWGKKSN